MQHHTELFKCRIKFEGKKGFRANFIHLLNVLAKCFGTSMICVLLMILKQHFFQQTPIYIPLFSIYYCNAWSFLEFEAVPNHSRSKLFELIKPSIYVHIFCLGSNVLEGLKNLGKAGLATLPMKDHVGKAHMHARNTFSLHMKANTGTSVLNATSQATPVRDLTSDKTPVNFVSPANWS